MTNNIEKSRLRLELTLKNSSVCVWLLIGNRMFLYIRIKSRSNWWKLMA